VWPRAPTGRAARGLGLRVTIPPGVVAHACTERSLRELVHHGSAMARRLHSCEHERPAERSAMREYGHFDCIGGAGEARRVWHRLAADGTVLSDATALKLYLHVRTDAERHGSRGAGLFRKPNAAQVKS
jgi:hypothetical protein